MMIPVIRNLTLSLDTNIYASADVLADRQLLADVVNRPGDRCILQSVVVLDEDAQGIAFDLVFLDSDVTLGAENAPAAITDANARQIVGVVPIASGDYLAASGTTIRVATKSNIELLMRPLSTGKDLYVGAITRGTPTHTAAGLRLKLGFKIPA